MNLFPEIDLEGKVILDWGIIVASLGSGPTTITNSLNPIASENGSIAFEANEKNEEDHGGPKGATSPIHRRLRKVPVWTQDFIMG